MGRFATQKGPTKRISLSVRWRHPSSTVGRQPRAGLPALPPSAGDDKCEPGASVMDGWGTPGADAHAQSRRVRVLGCFARSKQDGIPILLDEIHMISDPVRLGRMQLIESFACRIWGFVSNELGFSISEFLSWCVGKGGIVCSALLSGHMPLEKAEKQSKSSREHGARARGVHLTLSLSVPLSCRSHPSSFCYGPFTRLLSLFSRPVFVPCSWSLWKLKASEGSPPPSSQSWGEAARA